MSFAVLIAIGAVIAITVVIGLIVAVVLIASNRGRDERDH